MTARLLVLGNSHTSAIRAALAADPERWSDISVDFLGFRSPALAGLKIAKGEIRPMTDIARAQFARLNRDQTHWSLTGYHVIAVVGLDFKPLNTVAIARTAVWPDLPSLAEYEDIATMRPTLVSRPAAEATLSASLEGSDAVQMVRSLRGATDTPIFVVPCPRLNHKGKWVEIPRYYGHGRAIKSGDADDLNALWETTARAVLRRSGAKLIPQPPETVVDQILTRRKFMRDAEVSIATHSGQRTVPDLTHANAEYGALILQRLMKKTRHAYDAAQPATEGVTPPKAASGA